jgi:hypothetical protein
VGAKKYLAEVQFIYRADPSFDDTIVNLYGVLSRSGPGGAAQIWIDLGCRRVAVDRVDRDVIPVGRRTGGFKKIRLSSRGGDVHLLDLDVVYNGGQHDDIQVRRLLRQGERTRPLDLRGWERRIERVVLR